MKSIIALAFLMGFAFHASAGELVEQANSGMRMAVKSASIREGKVTFSGISLASGLHENQEVQIQVDLSSLRKLGVEPTALINQIVNSSTKLVVDVLSYQDAQIQSAAPIAVLIGKDARLY